MPVTDAPEPKSKLGPIIAVVGLAAIAYATYKASTTVMAVAQCYVDQFGATVPVQVGLKGRTTGIGPAHGTCLFGEDGVCYGLVDQNPASGPETRYQKPGPNAGALAVAWWNFYWTGTDIHNADGSWTSNRCYFLPPGRVAQQPPTGPLTCTNPIPHVPHSAPASGVFNPNLFDCPGQATATPAVQTPTPTYSGGLICVTVTPATICVTKTPSPQASIVGKDDILRLTTTTDTTARIAEIRMPMFRTKP